MLTLDPGSWDHSPGFELNNKCVKIDVVGLRFQVDLSRANTCLISKFQHVVREIFDKERLSSARSSVRAGYTDHGAPCTGQRDLASRPQ